MGRPWGVVAHHWHSRLSPSFDPPSLFSHACVGESLGTAVGETAVGESLGTALEEPGNSLGTRLGKCKLSGRHKEVERSSKSEAAGNVEATVLRRSLSILS